MAIYGLSVKLDVYSIRENVEKDLAKKVMAKAMDAGQAYPVRLKQFYGVTDPVKEENGAESGQASAAGSTPMAKKKPTGPVIYAEVTKERPRASCVVGKSGRKKRICIYGAETYFDARTEVSRGEAVSSGPVRPQLPGGRDGRIHGPEANAILQCLGNEEAIAFNIPPRADNKMREEWLVDCFHHHGHEAKQKYYRGEIPEEVEVSIDTQKQQKLKWETMWKMPDGDNDDLWKWQVRPEANQLLVDCKIKDMIDGFDSGAHKQIQQVNTPNVNMFLNAFRMKDSEDWDYGSVFPKVVSFIRAKLLGMKHEGPAEANPGMKWWQDPEASKDRDSMMYSRNEISRGPQGNAPGGRYTGPKHGTSSTSGSYYGSSEEAGLRTGRGVPEGGLFALPCCIGCAMALKLAITIESNIFVIYCT